MTTLHDQAMSYVYQQVLHRLLDHLSQGQRASLQLLVQRLLVAAGGLDQLGDFKVMLAYGGGRDSAFALACLRAAQLSIAARASATFELRVVTARHLGMSPAVIANIERTYSALVMHDDPRVELLVLDDGDLRPFDARQPLSPRQQQAERLDTLVTGHLTAGQVRPMFCNRFYLGLAELYREGMSWQGGVDALISADSLPERKRYLAWGRRMMREAGVACMRPIGAYPGVFLQGLVQLRRQYASEVLGRCDVTWRALPSLRRVPRLIDIVDLVKPDGHSGSAALLGLLGYRHDELTLGLTHSACANPLLMAHLCGLRAQFVEGCTYADGVYEHLSYVGARMHRSSTPAIQQAHAIEAWQGSERLALRRGLADAFAQQAYGVKEAQWVCLLFAPFVEQGRGLEHFLTRCHPDMQMAAPYLHNALQGLPAAQPLVQWLEEVSGVPLATLQMLYRRESQAGAGATSLLARARDSDPERLRH